MFTLPEGTQMKTEMLKGFLDRHTAQVTKRYKLLEDMYLSKHEILTREDKAPYKPDNRIVANFAKYIVDTMNGFFIGIPIMVRGDDDETNEFIRYLSQYNSQDDVNAELSKVCSIFGHGFEMYYVDEDSQLCVTYLSPTEAFMIYDESIIERPMYFVRRFKDSAGKEKGSISDCKVIRYFEVEGAEVKWKDEDKAHSFGGVPATEFIGNEERQGLFEPVMTDINAYNKALSEKSNDVDYFADAYMKVLGAQVDEKTIKRIRDNRIINFEGEEAKGMIVDFLNKPDCDTTQENLLDRLERIIFQVSKVPNISDATFADTTGIALRYKLQPMSNLAKVKERKFTAGMARRYKLLFGHPLSKVPADAWISLTYRFTQNMPANLLEETEIAKNMEGITSREKQLETISTIEDVKSEMDRIWEEQGRWLGDSLSLDLENTDEQSAI